MSYSRYSAMLCTENKNMKNMLSLTPKDLRTSTLVSIRGWSDEPGLASQRRWPLSWALKERNYTLRKGRNKHMQRNRHEVAWVIIQCCWDLASGARAGEGKTGGWAEARWQACGSHAWLPGLYQIACKLFSNSRTLWLCESILLSPSAFGISIPSSYLFLYPSFLSYLALQL